jgi:hypothetical protein
MQTQEQGWDHKAGPDFGKIGTRNMKVYSYAERRDDCTTCSHPFHADRGTFFDTVRTDRQVILKVVAMWVERTRLRAMCRIEPWKLATTLHWVDRAGHQAAAVSRHGMTGVHLAQAQIDARWTFIKKTRNTSNRVIPTISGMLGFGEPSLCLVACVWCLISRSNAASQKQSPAWPN